MLPLKLMCLLMIKTVNVVDRINVLADLKTAKPLELPPSLKSGIVSSFTLGVRNGQNSVVRICMVLLQNGPSLSYQWV